MSTEIARIIESCTLHKEFNMPIPLQKRIQQVLSELASLPLLAHSERKELEQLLVALEQEFTTGVSGATHYSMIEQLEHIEAELEVDHPALATALRSMSNTISSIGV